MATKIIRDPVHDVIAFQLEKPIDALLFKLLGARELQRLRRIRQLGLASLAYPGADHSRYSHSVGVMQTARRMLAQLAQSFTLKPGEMTVCLAAALLHDIGHGPLSHVFERVSDIPHEKLTLRLIEDPDGDVHRILAEHDRQLPALVVDFLRGSPPRTFYADILSSQLDADRFDYLLRDNLMTGSRYGGFDLQWLLHALTLDESASRLGVMAKGLSAVEAYLQCRYHMYRNVYFHKVVRTAEGMIRLALQRAKRLAVQQRLPWPSREDGLVAALLGQRLTRQQFLDLDDVALLHCLKLWAAGEDAVLAKLCDGLLYRRLYKTIDLTQRSDISAVLEKAQAAVKLAGGDEAYDIIYDEPADTPYEIFDGESPGGDILVADDAGRLTSFASLSRLTGALSRELMFRRLHVTPNLRAAVLAAIG